MAEKTRLHPKASKQCEQAGESNNAAAFFLACLAANKKKWNWRAWYWMKSKGCFVIRKLPVQRANFDVCEDLRFQLLNQVLRTMAASQPHRNEIMARRGGGFELHWVDSK